MKWFSLASLRVRLMLFAVILLIPAIFLTIYNTRELESHAAIDSRRNALHLVRILSEEQNRVIENARHLLTALSHIPPIKNLRHPQCDSLLTGMIRDYPTYSNIVLADSSGKIICSAIPSDRQVNVNDREWFQRTAKSGEFSIGEVQTGRFSGDQIVVLGYPIKNSSGASMAVAGIGIKLNWLNSMIRITDLTKQTFVSIFDADGTVIAHYPNPEEHLGAHLFDEALYTRIRELSEGSLTARLGPEQREYLLSFSQFGPDEMETYVSVGIPTEHAFATAQQYLVRQIILLGGIFAVVVLTIWFGGNTLFINKVKKLIRVTRQVAEGDFSARTEIPPGEGELNQLAANFDQMTKALGAQRESLQKTSRRYQELLDNIRDVIFVLAPDGTVTSISAAFDNILGFSRDDWLGKKFQPAIHPDDLPKFESYFNMALRGEETSLFEVRAKSGRTYLTIEYRLSPRVMGDQIDGVIGVARDVTRRKEAEELLRRQEEEYRSLVQNVPDVISRVDREYRHLFINSVIERYIGIPPEVIIGNTVRETGLPNSFVQMFETNIDAVFRTGEEQQAEYDFATNQGHRHLHIRFVPEHSDEGEVETVLNVARDVTELRETEEALHESERLLQETFEALEEAVIVVEVDSRKIITCNPATERIFGYSKEEMLGKSTRMLHVDEKHYRQFDEMGVEPLQASGSWETEYRMRKKDGTIFPTEHTISILEDAKGNWKSVVSVVRDISERKKAEQELRRSRERLRSLARNLQSAQEEERRRISRDIHDELGQQLTAMQLDAIWFKRELRDDPTEYIERIDSMIALIDDAIATIQRIASELHPGMLEDLGLLAVLEWETTRLARRAGFEYALDFSDEEPELSHEKKTSLYRIFQGAMTNIIRHAEASLVRVQLTEDESDYILTVEDNGRGISQDQIDNTKSLGINSMRERVQTWGGQLVITGDPDNGTTLVVTMPKGEGFKA
ncbi:MAG: PAS domain S-box protein [Candidatus Marinimicrobia bacterium]|nr:PAS domain S-box protein [Candidatus Neomarinimicrobiota bacterium]MCF7828812.1 PAS domain S-box protein [Candidatus Neomarinimicrobiota bacterium]MCF7880729.1 PAS domain S-box protein [Candidatus Neomarinimicrobiota bacterium]